MCQDPWLSCLTPEVPVGPPTQNATTLKVCDLLCPISNTWDSGCIQAHLPQYEGIIQKLITSSPHVADSLVWLPDVTGEYTTKTGYELACYTEPRPTQLPATFDCLKHICNLQTSPKINDFLWKVIKKAISVSSNLASHGVPPFACKRCGGIEDDIHVLMTCPFALEVWERSPLTWQPEATVPLIAQLLILNTRMITLPSVGLFVPLWPWLLWNLWKSRNKLCFDDRSFSAQDVVIKSITDAKGWQAAQTNEHVPHVRPTHPSHLFTPQIRALSGALCFVDAAWNHTTGTFGVASIFKNVSPPPLDISFHQRSISSALMEEAIAVCSAVMKAASSNLRSLTVLYDSKVLISMLKTKTSRPALFGMLFDISYFSYVLDFIVFLFVLRLQNTDTDCVAKLALVMAEVSPCVEG